jgi:hypothetical protein
MGYTSTSSLLTVKLTEKIKLFRTSGTFSEKQPTMLVHNQRTKEKLVKARGERK